MTSFKSFMTTHKSSIQAVKDMAFKNYCYALYQFNWILSRGFTLDDTFFYLLSYASDLYIDATSALDITVESIQNDWDGLNGQIYASFYEFLDSEYQDENYMKTLLSPEDFETYKKDVLIPIN